MASPLDGSDARVDNRGFAETVLVSGEPMVGILNDVLELAKIEAVRLDLDSVDFDLRTLVEDVTDLLSVSTQDRGVELACRFPLDMPATMRGDRDRLRRVLTELVGSAVRATATGEVMVELTMAETEDERVTVRFEVVGTGIGDAAVDQQQLFASFPPVDAGVIRRRGAKGLGLALAYELVQLMDGQVGVRRELDHGTNFWFTVTLQRGWSVSSVPATPRHTEQRVFIVDDRVTARTADRVARSTSGVGRPTGAGRPPGQILLAEDNPVNQRVGTAMLENLGFQVDLAG